MNRIDAILEEMVNESVKVLSISIKKGSIKSIHVQGTRAKLALTTTLYSPGKASCGWYMVHDTGAICTVVYEDQTGSRKSIDTPFQTKGKGVVYTNKLTNVKDGTRWGARNVDSAAAMASSGGLEITWSDPPPLSSLKAIPAKIRPLVVDFWSYNLKQITAQINNAVANPLKLTAGF